LVETILIVSGDAGERDRLARIGRQLGYRSWATSSREAALWVARTRPITLVLGGVELTAQEDAGWLARFWEQCPELPVVLIGPGSPVTVALESLRAGALDFIPRESRPRELREQLSQALARRERWIVERRRHIELEQRVTARERELHGTYRQVLEALGEALDTRHPETQDHTRRVVTQSVQVARSLGVTGDALMEIEWGAALHDVGKIGIPDAVLLKPGSLTDEEWRTMKTHCEIGYRMLAGFSFLRGALPIVLHHHERFDGAGYPFGLEGEEIPFGARVFAVADAYDAMTSDRPYRSAMPAPAALSELHRCAGSQFDPTVVRAFVNVVAQGGDLAEAA
jgi:response regulator RpfG family c-di-GMP phosphodiesterase